MTQNYLFIDIDGPLLPAKSHMFPENREFLDNFQIGESLTSLMKNHPLTFDPWCVRAHNLLAKYGKAKIVIVTNWRLWCDIEELQELFADQGLVFDYAVEPSCGKRGLSSGRAQDVAYHIEDILPNDSRALIVDDQEGLIWLNNYLPLEGDHSTARTNYVGVIEHNDRQVGYVEEKPDIHWKWLEVSYQDGISYKQFKLGAKFFDIDWDELNAKEFGNK